MLRPRVIPCLLISGGGLVQSEKFGNYRYIGDPINTVRIFNEKQVDELMVFDVDASKEGAEPNYELIARLADECDMPLCYGGGITNAEQAARLVNLGVEKISINTCLFDNPAIVSSIAQRVGSQSTVVTIDYSEVRGFMRGGFELLRKGSAGVFGITSPIALAIWAQSEGAGEVVFNCVNRDGAMAGLDVDFAKEAVNELSIPATFLGGAGSFEHLKKFAGEVGLAGLGAGSFFVFKGKLRAVLVNYLDKSQKNEIRDEALRAGSLSH